MLSSKRMWFQCKLEDWVYGQLWAYNCIFYAEIASIFYSLTVIDCRLVSASLRWQTCTEEITSIHFSTHLLCISSPNEPTLRSPRISLTTSLNVSYNCRKMLVPLNTRKLALSLMKTRFKTNNKKWIEIMEQNLKKTLVWASLQGFRKSLCLAVKYKLTTLRFARLCFQDFLNIWLKISLNPNYKSISRFVLYKWLKISTNTTIQL